MRSNSTQRSIVSALLGVRASIGLLAPRRPDPTLPCLGASPDTGLATAGAATWLFMHLRSEERGAACWSATIGRM